MQKQLAKRWIFDCALMVVIAFIFALNYELFIVKNQFAPAGINGIATMIQYKLGFSIGYFSLIVNVPLCIFAFFCINRDFAVKTFIFSIIYSLSVLLLETLDLSRFQYDAQGIDTIYPVLIAGAVGGFVYGVAFRRDSSTGGADIIAKYVSKKDPMLNFFWINFAINAAIAAASFFVYAVPDASGALQYDFKPVCLCLLYCLLSSFVGNAIIKGSKSAYRFTVITSHADEIDAEILAKLKHSATRVHATGAYSNTSREMIVCVVNRRQLIEFKDILKKFDDTFAFVETVNETIGNFSKVK